MECSQSLQGGTDTSIERELRALLGDGSVLPGDTTRYLHDATELEGVRGRAAAVVLPADESELARAMAWCYRHDVPMVPRGGGTGFAGGCVPLDGEVVLATERLRSGASVDAGEWRMRVPAGLTTTDVRRLARENGLYYPVDPGSSEQCLIGGNIATNAGGPHAFKYGVTRSWVTGLRALLPDGEAIEVGGPTRKDVAGYDLVSLLTGSEGTLAVITSAWLRLVPAPEAAAPLLAAYPDAEAGCEAIAYVLASGVVPAAVEFLDAGALAAAAGAFPGELPDGAGFAVIVEADGDEEGVTRELAELRAALEEGALALVEPRGRREIEDFWRWRDGVALSVAAVHGGKMSEDIAVPLERLREAVEGTIAIGAKHGLDACSWGHAGDGNLHSTFMLNPRDPEQVERARAAAGELFALARELGGTVTGEHGLGWLKRDQLHRQWPEAAVRLQRELKALFDPKGLLNPGKKEP
jgi:glycolate oxidase subunit GlcD